MVSNVCVCVCVCVSTDEVDYMKSIVVDEMFLEMDKNRDGSVTVEEYIGRQAYIQGTLDLEGTLALEGYIGGPRGVHWT